MDIVRSLFHAISLIKGAKPKKEGLPRSGKPWNDQEDQELKNAFVGNVKVAEIANLHQRTTGAIRSRLQKLGLMDEDGNRVQ